MNYGFIKIAAAVPEVQVANPKYNLQGFDSKKYHITLHPVRKVEEALRVIFG